MEDAQTAINVRFWLEDDAIFSFWTNTFPTYRPGDDLYLRRAITPIGEKKFEHLKIERMNGAFVVDQVTHSAEETISESFSVLHKMDVFLKLKSDPLHSTSAETRSAVERSWPTGNSAPPVPKE
jgi:hypothetical protein